MAKHNRFQPLTDLSTDENDVRSELDLDEDEMKMEKEAPKQLRENKSLKPPPIIIHGKPGVHKQMIDYIKSFTESVDMKYGKQMISIYLCCY